jgi:hypothetical protein
MTKGDDFSTNALLGGDAAARQRPLPALSIGNPVVEKLGAAVVRALTAEAPEPAPEPAALILPTTNPVLQALYDLGSARIGLSEFKTIPTVAMMKRFFLYF